MLIKIIDATTLTQKSRSTILRAIKSGRLSANRNATGEYLIDTSELSRVFVIPKIQNEQVTTRSMDDHAQAIEPAPNNAVLAAKVEGLQALVEELKQRLDKAEQRLDESLESERRLMLMITHQQSGKPAPEMEVSVLDKIFKLWK